MNGERVSMAHGSDGMGIEGVSRRSCSGSSNSLGQIPKLKLNEDKI